jgi:hypothetical protein
MKKILTGAVLILTLGLFAAPSVSRAVLAASVKGVVVTDTTATISGMVLTHILPTVTIKYNTATSVGMVDTDVDQKTGAFTAKLIDLSPGTLYTYFVIDDQISTKVLAGPLTFNTKSAVFGFRVTGTGATSVNLSGVVASKNPDMQIMWGESSVSEYEHIFQPLINAKLGFSEDLVDLTPNTSYKVVLVKASNKTALIGGPFTFKTPPITALPLVGAIGSDFAIIQSTATKGATGLVVYYGVTKEALSNQATMTVVDGTWSAKLTGLSPEKQYYYKIYGPSAAGPAPYTADFYGFTTQAKQAGAGKTRTIVDTIGTVLPTPIAGEQKGLVTCGNKDQPACGFSDVFGMLNRLISFLIMFIVPSIATIIIIYAGFLLLTSGGEAEARTKAKTLIGQVLIGVILITGAWVVIKTILIGLGYDTTIFPTFY